MHQQYLNNATSSLHSLSSDELREIFGDDDKLDERIDQIVRIFLKIPRQFTKKFFVSLLIFQLKSLENEKDVIITENRTLAESNLEKEPMLIEMRSKINDLSEEFRNLSENVQLKLTQISESSFEAIQVPTNLLLIGSLSLCFFQNRKHLRQIRNRFQRDCRQPRPRRRRRATSSLTTYSTAASRSTNSWNLLRCVKCRSTTLRPIGNTTNSSRAN